LDETKSYLGEEAPQYDLEQEKTIVHKQSDTEAQRHAQSTDLAAGWLMSFWSKELPSSAKLMGDYRDNVFACSGSTVMLRCDGEARQNCTEGDDVRLFARAFSRLKRC